MSTKELAVTLKMTSANSVRMARRRGGLPLDPIEFAHRRGQYYSTEDVARLLAKLIYKCELENAM